MALYTVVGATAHRPTRSAGRRSASSPRRSATANPAYRDPEAAKALGHPDVIAPPTFVFVHRRSAGDAGHRRPELGLDYSRVVHGDQRFAYTRPVRAGDRLTVTSTIETSSPRRATT